MHYKLVAAGAAVSAAAGDQVEAATGSEVVGDIAEFAVDLMNPASDIKETVDFAEEVFTDLLEAIYEVELDEQADQEEEE